MERCGGTLWLRFSEVAVLIALKTLGIFTKTIHAVLWSTVHWAVSPCHKNTLFSTTQPCYEYVSQHDLCLVLTTKWWHVKRVNERMRGSGPSCRPVYWPMSRT